VVPTSEDILERLCGHADPANVAGMARYGISPEGTLGVTLPVLRNMAKEVKPAAKADPQAVHELAAQLWASGVHEARILASLVDVPALVTREQADNWAADVDSWDVCDGLCNNLLDKTPFAYEKAQEWASAGPEFVKRAGFVLMCTRALHDKAAEDGPFLHFLEIVEREAEDERPMVRKAVNWALRQIGKRNDNLHAAAVEVAARLRESESRAARWVASDALRELESDAVLARVAKSKSR
jgi:3-methyladenine DNA glycosylase AlkD